MKKIILTLVLCVLSIQAHAAATCSSVTLGHRSYTLCAPTTPLNPAPLVISLHPGLSQGGDGTTTGWSGAAALLNGVLTTQAETDGFYVAYPDGWGKLPSLRTWNAKPGGCCAFAMETDQKDVDFIARVIADIEQSYTIDTDHVVLAGFSNGSMLSMTYACQNPTQIKGIAAVAGPLLLENYNCPTLAGIPITYIHGSVDTTVPPAGGVGDTESYSFPNTDTMLAYLTTAGATVTEIELTGAGHSWSDAVSYLSSQESTTYEAIVSDIAVPVPAQISGLVAWYDAAKASTITSAAGAVSQWDDRSGNGNHATQGTGADQPTTGVTTLNGKNVLDFAGDHVIATSTITYRTAIFVMKSGNPASLSAIFGGNTPYQGEYTFLNTNQTDVSYDISIDGSTGKTGTAYFNGGTGGSGANIDLGNTDAQNKGSGIWLVVFDGSNHADYLAAFGAGATTELSGSIAEMLFYSGALTTAQMNTVGAYLADKWGITWTNL